MPAAISPAVPAGHEALEIAGRIIDRQIQDDRCYPDLSELLAVPAPGEQRPFACVASAAPLSLPLPLPFAGQPREPGLHLPPRATMAP